MNSVKIEETMDVRAVHYRKHYPLSLDIFRACFSLLSIVKFIKPYNESEESNPVMPLRDLVHSAVFGGLIVFCYYIYGIEILKPDINYNMRYAAEYRIIPALVWYLKRLWEDRLRQWLAGILICGNISVVFFTGYMEAYLIPVCSIVLIVISMLYSAQSGKLYLVPYVIFAGNLLWHQAIIFLLPPLFIFTLWIFRSRVHRFYELFNFSRPFVSILVISGGTGIIYLGIRNWTTAMFLPVFSSPGLHPSWGVMDSAAIFNLRHLFEVFNLLLHFTPVHLLLIVLFAPVMLYHLRHSVQNLLLFYTLYTSCIIFLLVWSSRSYELEWDFYTMLNTGIFISVLPAALNTIPSRRIIQFAIPMLTVTLLYSGTWLWLNYQTEKNMQYFIDLSRLSGMEEDAYNILFEYHLNTADKQALAYLIGKTEGFQGDYLLDWNRANALLGLFKNSPGYTLHIDQKISDLVLSSFSKLMDKIQDDPTNEKYYYFAFRNFRKGLSLEIREDLIQKAIQLNPQNPDYHLYLAQAYEDHKPFKFNATVREYIIADSLFTVNPSYGTAFSPAAPKESLGAYYLEIGRYRDTIRLAHEILALEPESIIAEMLFVRGYYRLGEYDALMQHFTVFVQKLEADQRKEKSVTAYHIKQIIFAGIDITRRQQYTHAYEILTGMKSFTHVLSQAEKEEYRNHLASCRKALNK